MLYSVTCKAQPVLPLSNNQPNTLVLTVTDVSGLKFACSANSKSIAGLIYDNEQTTITTTTITKSPIHLCPQDSYLLDHDRNQMLHLTNHVMFSFFQTATETDCRKMHCLLHNLNVLTFQKWLQVQHNLENHSLFAEIPHQSSCLKDLQMTGDSQGVSLHIDMNATILCLLEIQYFYQKLTF